VDVHRSRHWSERWRWIGRPCSSWHVARPVSAWIRHDHHGIRRRGGCFSLGPIDRCPHQPARGGGDILSRLCRHP
jgi:hypothetical protein